MDRELPYFQVAPGDHYEETNAVGPNCASDLMQAFVKLLRELKRQ